jgi:hypothetical protein
MTPAESVGLPETCEHSIPVTQRGLRVGGNMLLAHGAHNREEHTAIRRGGGSVWQDYSCFGSLSVDRGVPRDDRNPGDKY